MGPAGEVHNEDLSLMEESGLIKLLKTQLKEYYRREEEEQKSKRIKKAGTQQSLFNIF
jgi:hypothetical protein